jgi:hypothetical protein
LELEDSRVARTIAGGGKQHEQHHKGCGKYCQRQARGGQRCYRCSWLILWRILWLNPAQEPPDGPEGKAGCSQACSAQEYQSHV